MLGLSHVPAHVLAYVVVHITSTLGAVMNGDEYYMPGGLYDADGSSRTDVYLKEVGPGINEAKGVPLTLELALYSGSLAVVVIECAPDDIARLGAWLIATAKEVKERM